MNKSEIAEHKLEIVDDSVKGLIVLSKTEFRNGDLICIGRPVKTVKKRDIYSLQLDGSNHVHLDKPATLFSHSCDPNMYLMNNDFGGYSFYALRDINSGEELSFHYGTSEAYSIAVPSCACLSGKCLGKSFGFKEASSDLQKRLYSFGISDYLKEFYLSN